MDAGGGGKSGVKSDINVTPLVDIVLVLLIIFIVITPAVNNAVKLPTSRHSLKQPAEPGAQYLTLILPAARDKDGKVTGCKKVTIDDPQKKQEDQAGFLIVDDKGQEVQSGTDKLKDFVRGNMARLVADKRVFIKADADLPFKYVNILFQICRDGGADEASIVTSEDKSSEKK